MMKFFTFLAVAAMLAGFSACSNDDGGVYEIIVSGKADDGFTPMELYYKGAIPIF